MRTGERLTRLPFLLGSILIFSFVGVEVLTVSNQLIPVLAHASELVGRSLPAIVLAPLPWVEPLDPWAPAFLLLLVVACLPLFVLKSKVYTFFSGCLFSASVVLLLASSAWILRVALQLASVIPPLANLGLPN
jgi:hypothetical protein